MQPEMQTVDRPGSNVEGKTQTSEARRWNFATKLSFRFAFVYFGLYNLFIPLHLLSFPPFTQLYALYNRMCSLSVRWFAVNVLHVAHDFSKDYLNTSAGSKDTTFVYVEALVYFLVAVVAAVAWSVFDRRRPNYSRLYNWFLVYLRLSLAAAMIPYGAAKIFPFQFAIPPLSKLVQTYGNSSPMGLLWTFMGYSRLYTVFGGATELLAGVLLVFPRLATLGALVCAGVMTNVLMLNLGYDVPVKLGCILMITMALIIVLPDMVRLLDFFVRNRTAPPAPERPLFRKVALNRAAVALQIAFGLVMLVYNLHQSNSKANLMLAARNTPLYGIWTVEDFSVDAVSRPPLLTDEVRWRRLIIDSNESAMAQGMTGTMQYLHYHPNPRDKDFSLTRYGDPGWIAEFTYDNSRPDLLVLRGRMGGRPTTMTLRREDESQFLLTSRGFHWIQEMSVNQ